MPEIGAYRSYIEAALIHASNSHTFADVCDLVASGKAQFWPGPSSVIVTDIQQYPQHSVLNFWLAGGNLTELEAMTPPILAFGRSMGCKLAMFSGRRGWERTFLTTQGWQPKLVVFEKSLDGQNAG